MPWSNRRVTDTKGAGRRVSWVELYFDLIFVFAVGQVAHAIVVEPHWRGIAAAAGLFATLWWTWIGYVVLYNRHGENRAVQRLFVLAGTVPCALAAVEANRAAEGHVAGFALALAGARLVLAVAFARSAPEGRATGRRVGVGYALSTVAFAVSAVVPSPWRYLLWFVTLLQEAGFLLLNEARGRGVSRAQMRGRRRLGRNRREALRALMAPPDDPDLAVNAAHLAERFGLFMIILLGEIVISVGVSVLDAPGGATYWLGLIAGLVLAGALWWIYFESAAHFNEFLLRASGGNPAIAYGIYAGGHLMPAFALVVIAAGVSLSLQEHPAAVAPWLVTAGVAGYLVGTGAAAPVQGPGYLRLLRVLALTATVCLALLRAALTPPGVVAVTAMWTVGLAAVVSWLRPRVMRQLEADPLAMFQPPFQRPRAPGGR
jgi:low temperature requirement protein LtrA